MRRLAFALLLLLSIQLVFSEKYGQSTITLEKTWIITGEPGTEFNFEGIFVVNNSNQKVLALDADDGVEFKKLDDGVIKVAYKGRLDGKGKILSARATVLVYYDVKLPPDAALPEPTDNNYQSNYTSYTSEMAEKAKSLMNSGSTYETIRSIADWTNKYITYDISYFGSVVPAQEVFRDRKGVCVEYTHLFISFMNVLGLKTRYVSGYVLGENWQPHAWAEVLLPNGKYLPVDPTFGEVQNLDSSHVASYFSNDQSEVLDKIESNGKVSFSFEEKISAEELVERQEPLAVATVDFDETLEAVTVRITNRKSEYVFASYSFVMPEETGNGEQGIILLSPNEVREYQYTFNKGYTKTGYSYSIPVMVSLNDYSYKKDIVFSKEAKAEPPAAQNCPLALGILAATFVAVSIARR